MKKFLFILIPIILIMTAVVYGFLKKVFDLAENYRVAEGVGYLGQNDDEG